MKYYIHAYADAQKRLPDKEVIIEAENDDAAYRIACRKFPEYEEIYTERASEELVREFENQKKKTGRKSQC